MVLIELFRSISECEMATKGLLGRLVGGDFASSGTSGAVPKTGGTVRASAICPSSCAFYSAY